MKIKILKSIVGISMIVLLFTMTGCANNEQR